MRDINIARSRDFTDYMHLPRRHQRFAGHAAHGILCENRVENRVRNLICHLIGMALRHRLGSEQYRFAHAKLHSAAVACGKAKKQGATVLVHAALQ